MTDPCSYGARLPSLSNMLCQKLGGPKQHSPTRPPLVKAATSGDLLRPGTALRRQPMQKSRRTLERVLTDERIASRRPTPSLSRSATDSVLPGLKREDSAISLYSIPPTKLDLQNSRRYSQREVDLSAATQAYEAKLQKKAKVEKELQGAIAALKKPNPRMAVKELVEAAERRAAASNSRSRLLSNIEFRILTFSRTENPWQKLLCPRCPSHGNAQREQAQGCIRRCVRAYSQIQRCVTSRRNSSIQCYSGGILYTQSQWRLCSKPSRSTSLNCSRADPDPGPFEADRFMVQLILDWKSAGNRSSAVRDALRCQGCYPSSSQDRCQASRPISFGDFQDSY